MPKSVNLAIVGATGLVGRAVLDVLSESSLDVDNIFPLASADSEGDTVEFGKRQLTVHKLDGFDFEQVQIAIFCVPANVARDYLAVAEKAGCWIIDHSTASRGDEAVPLVAAGINSQDIQSSQQRHIASPDSTTMHLAVLLQAVTRLSTVERINVSVMRCVSSIGKKGVDELSNQSIALFNLNPIEHRAFQQQIAFNILPDTGNEDGYPIEDRLQDELRYVLHDDALPVNASSFHVPVFYGYSYAIQLELADSVEIDKLTALIKKSPNLTYCGDSQPDEMATAVKHGANQEGIFISHVRYDPTWNRGINLWLVADNIRQWAAINSVQLAEILVKDYL